MLKEYMIGLGFNEEQVDIIVNTRPVLDYMEETLYKKIKELFKFFFGIWIYL